MGRIQKRERGSAKIEYAVLIGFISIALVGILTTLGEKTRDKVCRPFLNFDVSSSTSYGGAGNSPGLGYSDGRVNQADVIAIKRESLKWDDGDYHSDFDFNCDGVTYGTSGGPLNGAIGYRNFTYSQEDIQAMRDNFLY